MHVMALAPEGIAFKTHSRGWPWHFVAQQHGLTTGDGPLVVRSTMFRDYPDGDDRDCDRGVSTDSTLPMGLVEGVRYWAIVPLVQLLDGRMAPSGDKFLLAATQENAKNGVAVDLTTPGRGFFLLSPAEPR